MRNWLMTIRSRQLAFHLTWLTFSSVALTTACVTVNVNFPESAVQKATDDYVRDLYRAKEKGKTPSADAAAQKLTRSLSFSLIPSAYAEDLKIQSEKADQIKKRQAARLDEITAQKRAGVIGETNQGKVVVKDSKLPPLLMKKMTSLVDAENRDREELYKEVARINGLASGQTSTIEKSFSRSFQAISPSGTWIQDADGKWTRKP